LKDTHSAALKKMDQDAYKESSKAEKDKKESLTKEWQT
jgi:hypothetical protein